MMRKAMSNLNSSIASSKVRPLIIFSVARTDEMSTGIATGKSRNERRTFLP